MATNRLLEAVKNAKNKYSRSDSKHIKPKEGRNVYRIVAPTSASWIGPNGEFWADLGVHWIKTSLAGKPLCVVGNREICFGEPCDVGFTYSSAISHAKESGYDDDTIKLIESMRPQKSVLFQAIERTTDPKSQKVEVLELKPSAAQQIMDLYMQYAEEGQDMFDPKSGVDIVISRSGQGINTEYTVNIKPGSAFAPVSKEAIDSCIDLREHIEKEYFRGDEPKAIATLSQVAGINVPRLASSRPAAALTASPAAADKAAFKAAENSQVPDAEYDEDEKQEEVQEEVAKPVKAVRTKPAAAAAPEPTTVDADDLDDLDALLDDINNI